MPLLYLSQISPAAFSALSALSPLGVGRRDGGDRERRRRRTVRGVQNRAWNSSGIFHWDASDG